MYHVTLSKQSIRNEENRHSKMQITEVLKYCKSKNTNTLESRIDVAP
jgi:hypothetical protein